MTREDTIKLLAILKASFPAAFRSMTRETGEAMVELWSSELEPYPPGVAMKAMAQLVENSRFMPSIAEMLKQVRKIGLDMQLHLMSDIALGRKIPLEKRRAVYAIAQAGKPENGPRALPQNDPRALPEADL